MPNSLSRSLVMEGYIGWLLVEEARWRLLPFCTLSTLVDFCLSACCGEGAVCWVRVWPQRENVSLVSQMTLGLSCGFCSVGVTFAPWASISFVKWGHYTRWSPRLFWWMEVSCPFILLCKTCIDLFSGPPLDSRAELCILLMTFILMSRLPFWKLHMRETWGWNSNKTFKKKSILIDWLHRFGSPDMPQEDSWGVDG